MPEQIPIDAVPLPLLVIGPDGRVRRANDLGRAQFLGEPEGRDIAELLPDEADALTLLEGLARDGTRAPIHGRRANGVPFTAYAIVRPEIGGSLVAILREIKGDLLISEAQRFLDAAFDSAPIGMALYNTDGEFIRVNDAFARMLRTPTRTLLGRRDQEFTHPDDRAADVAAAWQILEGRTDRWQTEKRFVAADGTTVWVIANLTFIRDEGGRPLCWLGQFQDITERRRSEEQLRHMADHDELTGLANRRRIIAELSDRALHAARYDEHGAVLLIDLDGFKEINDALGHAAGDRVLIEVAQALESRLRATDVAGRLGGDEFAVILPHASVEEARTVATALLEAIDAGGRVTGSCGIATYGPDEPSGPDLVLHRADRAMYAAKSGGGALIAVA